MPFIVKSKTNIKYILIIVFLAVLVGGGIYLSYNEYVRVICQDKHFSCEQNMSIECKVFGRCINIGPTACTQEAKLCPDGSYVGRTGPNCGFAPCPGTIESYLDQNAELKNFFEKIAEKYPSLSPDKIQQKEIKQIETRDGFSQYEEGDLRWTLSPDKTKAVNSLGYYGEPDSSLEIYNRKGDNKIELLKTCGTPCSYRGEFWLNNNQFVFIQTHEYYPPNGEERCTVNTKCTDIISVSLYDFDKNTETIYESPELERTDLNRPILLPSWPSRDLQIKAACESLYGKYDPYCQQTDETAGWQTYRNEEYGFEMEYPKSMIAKFTQQETTSWVQFLSDGSPLLEIMISPTTASSVEQFIEGPFGPRRQTLLGGEASILTNDPPQSTKPLELSKAFMVMTIHDSNAFVITYSNYKKTNPENLIDQILSTFKFTK